MKKNDSFKDYVLDQLQDVSGITARPMFGGYGLYRESVFFGIIFKGRLFFKTDERTRVPYRERGMKPFRPTPRQTLKNYFEVPVDAVEEPDELARWAKDAIDCCRGGN